MPELIDRYATIDAIPAPTDADEAEYYEKVCDAIEAMPTIEPEVRHGRWIDTPLPNSRVAKCSLCGFWQRTNGDDKTGKHLIHTAVYRYCAGCGARMDADHIADVSKKVGGADNG